MRLPDVDRIEINGDHIAFLEDGKTTGAAYVPMAMKYEQRGLCYAVEKAAVDHSAPEFIQFSGHHISPTSVNH